MRWYNGTTFKQNDGLTQTLTTRPDPTITNQNISPPWPKLGSAGARTPSQKKAAEAYGKKIATQWTSYVEKHEGLLYYTDGSAEMPKHNSNATISWGGVSAGYLKLDCCTKLTKTKDMGVSRMGDNVLGEMAAIDIALDDALDTQKLNTDRILKIVILSDCQEAIKVAIDRTRKTKYEDCGFNIRESISELSELGAEVIIDWVPGHSGTQGNEIADSIARMKLREIQLKDIENIYEVPRSATKQSVDAIMNTVWQQWWNDWEDTRSYTVMGKVGEISPLSHAGRISRREETVLTRLRVGNATHNGRLFELHRTESPNCQCGVIDSVHHRIFECTHYKKDRIALTETLDRHDITHNVYEMMGLKNKSKSAVKDIITEILKYLNETNLTALFLWNPRDEEFGVEGYVHMEPMAKNWTQPISD
jgi:ribonuclease HI